MTRWLRAGLLVAIAGSADLSAQGLSGASIEGTASTASGTPVAGASVALRHLGNGTTRATLTSSLGRYRFDHVEVGGPYRIEARAIGFELVAITGLTLHLGDRVERRLIFAERPVVLEDVVVRGSDLRDPGAGGASSTIPGPAVRTLPLLNRNFVGLFATTSQAVGFSIGGQHPRYNAIQVDGGGATDVFGVGVTPGSAAGAKAISLEALEELRILIAPFDVRQGGFTGGLINAVTRSGTNRFRGSVFGTVARPELVGADTAGVGVTEFNIFQYGLSVGGPIRRDRLHFFLAADLQTRRTPFVGPEASNPATGISDSIARRAGQVFRDRYGFDPGGPESPILSQPDRNLFTKLSWQPTPSHRLELSHNWVDASVDDLGRTQITRQNRDGWQLSNSGLVIKVRANTTRLRAVSAFGTASNELVASVQVVDEARESSLRVPLFLVQGSPGRYLAAGSVKGAQGTETDQRVIELTDNLSWSHGAHQFTVGTQNQRIRISDTFFLGAWGVWTFGSVDALERREANRYEVALPLRPRGPLADYGVTQLAGYIQDRWQASSRLTITAGLRADVPFFEAPLRNNALADSTALGVDTGRFPSGNVVVSPRVGLSYQLGAARRTLLRAGAGGFVGRPPLAWLTSAYVNTGQEQTLLVCTGPTVPAPVTEIDRLPSRCLGPGAPPAVATINTFTPAFRMPQAIKYVLGVDHDAGRGFTASIDVVHTRTRNQLYVTDRNLVPGSKNTEGRLMYGTINPITSAAVPARVVAAGFGPVFEFGNRSADRATSATVTVAKQWPSGGLIQMSYTWSKTEDLMSLAGLTGTFLLQNAPIVGTIANRRLSRSARDVPHNLVVIASAPIGFGVTGSMFLRARSGTPYAYVATGDANADGASGNDLLFVPRDAADVSLFNPARYPALDQFIASEPCLQRHRGRVMSRNACRNPAVRTMDVRLARGFSLGGQRLEVGVEAFNALALLKRDWGLVRETSAREQLELLAVAGWDAAANRPTYRVPDVLPSRRAVAVDLSRWRLQVGARYAY